MNKSKQKTKGATSAEKKTVTLNIFFSFFPGTFIFIFAFILYVNTLNHGYVLDDHTVISANRYTQEGFKGIPTLLTTAYWFGYDGTNSSVYRPFSTIIFALEHEFFGNSPFAGHLINVLIFAFTGALLFYTLRNLLNNNAKLNDHEKTLLAFIIALIYTAHPVHTEAVANIKSRDELLGFFWVMLAILFSLKSIQNNRRKTANMTLSSLCFFIALLSKENAFSFILIFPLIFYFFAGLELKRNMQYSSVYLAVACVYLALRISFLDKSFSGDFGNDLMTNSLNGAESYPDRIATAIFILVKYIWLLIVPHPLVYDYSYNHIPSLRWYEFKAIASVLFCGSLAGYAFYKIRTRNMIWFGVLYFFISISIVSNVVILVGAPMAERFLFTPSLAWCMILGALLCSLFPLHNKEDISLSRNWKLTAALTLIIAAYSFKTISRNMDWKDNYSLFIADIRHVPNSARAQLFLGIESLKYPEKYQGGIEAMKNAAKINPLYRDAFYNLGVGYDNQNKLDSASNCFMEAIKLDPDYLKAYGNLGMTLGKQDRYEEAVFYLLKAITIAPNYFDAYVNLGSVYGKKGEQENAIVMFNKAISLKPNSHRPYDNLGIIYAQKGEYQTAIQLFRKAIAIAPNHSNAYLNLAITYQTLGDNVNAELNYKKAFELDPKLKR